MVTMTIIAVNDAPTASGDSFTTAEDTPLTVPAGYLTSNDSAGPANEGGQTLKVIGVGPAGHGSVLLNADDTITYAPAANYNGPDSFTYVVQDNGATNPAADPLTATGTVTMT